MKYPVLLVFTLLFFSQFTFAQKPELINSGELIKSGGMLHDSGQYKKALNLYNKISRSDTNYVKALYEKAISCEADSQYKQAINYCQEALSQKEQKEIEADIYNTYGNILMDMGKNDEAIKIFETAIKKYPSYPYLYFNKGIGLINGKHYAEAEVQFQRTLLISPYMYSAHYQLGLAALNQGKFVQAFMCFAGYLLVNPEGRYWSKSVQALDQIARGTDAVMEVINKRSQPSQRYQETEDILLSKIALDKEYKISTSLDDPITRQLQAMIEKLDYQPLDKDFYIQYYLPFYKQIYDSHQFEPFIFHALSNVKLPVIEEYKKKNKKELEVVVTIAGNYFSKIRATRELILTKRDSIDQQFYFENGQLVGKGVLTNKGKTLTGKWEFYYPAGNLKSVGAYNSAGGREGDWTFYYASGKLKASEHYENGKQEGDQVYYFQNGNLSSREKDQVGALDGPYTNYYYAGGIKSTGGYAAGKKQGEEKNYFSNGIIESVNNYVNGVQTGQAETFFKSGAKKELTHYADGKSEGEYKSFFENGMINVEGVNSKGKGEGEWKYYFQDGKLKEKRNYTGDVENGTHQEYFENGQLSASYIAKKDKINGEALYYYEDGKLLSQYFYDSGTFKSAKYFNKQGSVVSTATATGDLTDLVTYNIEGYKNAHFTFNKKGNLEGPDTTFFASGRVNEINPYKDGIISGVFTSYFLNGNKKTEVNMADGKANGLQTDYYASGKIQAEGWSVDGDLQGEWRNYDEMGRLTSINYYRNGELDGYKEDFLPGGQKTVEHKYHLGWIEELTQFDAGGKVIKKDSFPKCSGRYTLVYPDGKPMQDGNYINGDFDGVFKSYFYDGSIESVSFYHRGLRDSTYNEYFFGGQKNTEGQYHLGGKTGVWKNWDEEGKLLRTINYVRDMINGPYTYFLPDGKPDFVAPYKDDQMDGTAQKYDLDGSLAYETIYKDGDLIAYTYLGKDGKRVPVIPVAIINGNLKSYFATGQVSRTCAFFDGVRNGDDILYYGNGQMRSIDSYAFSISVGTSKQYYPNGKLKAEYPYTNDVINGTSHLYNEKGILKKEVTYDSGLYNGPVKYFDDNGKLVKTLIYNYGTLISAKNE